jgi:1-phosphofructokinase/tagatose 6-phosphate kinase
MTGNAVILSTMAFLTVCLNPTLQKTLRFSSLVSGTVNRTDTHRLDAAGKGVNVSRVLTQLGKKVTHLTQLGGAMRPLFLSLCKEDSLAVEWVESGSPIRFCYTVITENNGDVTELIEESEPVAADTGERLLEKFDTLLPGNNCLIVSGTKADGFPDETIPLMVKKAKGRDMAVILDIRGKDLVESLQYQPDLIKPNLFEFALTFAPDLVKDNVLLGDERTVKERIKALCMELCEKYQCRIILTRGAQALWAAEADNFFEVCPSAVKPLNSTGSGDAFTAGLASALENGADFSAAIAEGRRCGALNALCLRPGFINETL